MRRRILQTIAATALLCLAGGGILLLVGARPIGPLEAAGIVLLLVSLILTSCLTLRILGFRRKLLRLLRLLLAGKFESGIRIGKTPRDEVVQLEELMNKLVEHLRTYDALRAARVRVNQMTFDTVLDAQDMATLVYEASKESIRCNAKMRHLLDCSQHTFTLKAIEGIPANRPFIDMLHQAGAEARAPKEAILHIQLPAHQSPHELTAKIIPVRDRDGTTPVVVILAPSKSKPAGQDQEE